MRTNFQKLSKGYLVLALIVVGTMVLTPVTGLVGADTSNDIQHQEFLSEGKYVPNEGSRGDSEMSSDAKDFVEIQGEDDDLVYGIGAEDEGEAAQKVGEKDAGSVRNIISVREVNGLIYTEYCNEGDLQAKCLPTWSANDPQLAGTISERRHYQSLQRTTRSPPGRRRTLDHHPFAQ